MFQFSVLFSADTIQSVYGKGLSTAGAQKELYSSAGLAAFGDPAVGSGRSQWEKGCLGCSCFLLL